MSIENQFLSGGIFKIKLSVVVIPVHNHHLATANQVELELENKLVHCQQNKNLKRYALS